MMLRLRPRSLMMPLSMIGAFAMGAALVHCGTTDFASALDGGTDGSGHTSGSGSGSDGGSTSTDSGMPEAGSGSGSGDAGSLACELAYDGKKCTVGATCCPESAPLCCVTIATNVTTTTCNAGTCPSGTLKTCTLPADCADFGGYCCVSPNSTTYGACTTAAECASPAVIKCNFTVDCPSPETCIGGVCQEAAGGSGSGTGASGSGSGSTGSGTGCAPKPCQVGACGPTNDGCGGTLACGACSGGDYCNDGTCSPCSGMACGTECCTPIQCCAGLGAAMKCEAAGTCPVPG